MSLFQTPFDTPQFCIDNNCSGCSCPYILTCTKCRLKFSPHKKDYRYYIYGKKQLPSNRATYNLCSDCIEKGEKLTLNSESNNIIYLVETVTHEPNNEGRLMHLVK